MAGKYPVTPKGEFRWAHITVPDTTFKAEGQFHVKVLLSGSEAEDMQKTVDDAHGEWKKGVNKSLLRSGKSICHIRCHLMTKVWKKGLNSTLS